MFVDTNCKGNVAELAIAKEAANLGLSVLMPMTEHERYDLVIGIGGRLLRVQCKWANCKGDVISAHLASSRRGPNGHIRKNYSAAEIDAIGLYCADLDRCFLVPIEVVAGQWAIRLRLLPARNGQRAAVHFADEYDLGAVAQLAERRHGMAEARGSNPLSSINQEDVVEGPVEVGAHQFRNHFGYYMERAAAGAEIHVSRHGKPYVQMSPAEVGLPSPSSPDGHA